MTRWEDIKAFNRVIALLHANDHSVIAIRLQRIIEDLTPPKGDGEELLREMTNRSRPITSNDLGRAIQQVMNERDDDESADSRNPTETARFNDYERNQASVLRRVQRLEEQVKALKTHTHHNVTIGMPS